MLKDDTYVPLEIEPVQWRQPFFSSETTSGGLTTRRLKARPDSPRSGLQLSASPELFIVCPQGISANEYQLLRAEENKEPREFRVDFQSLADAGLVAVSGTTRNRVLFETEKVGAGVFRLKLPPLGEGEYAFLPPSTVEQGRLYTFGLAGARDLNVAETERPSGLSAGAIVAQADPVEITRSSRTVYIAGTDAFPPEPLEKKLFEETEFRRGSLVLVKQRDRADLVIELDRKKLTWDFTYRMVHPSTGTILGAGKVIAWDGIRAAPGIAKQIIRRVRELRTPTPEKKKD